jgi:hypothetical protein
VKVLRSYKESELALKIPRTTPLPTRPDPASLHATPIVVPRAPTTTTTLKYGLGTVNGQLVFSAKAAAQTYASPTGLTVIDLTESPPATPPPVDSTEWGMEEYTIEPEPATPPESAPCPGIVHAKFDTLHQALDNLEALLQVSLFFWLSRNPN